MYDVMKTFKNGTEELTTTIKLCILRFHLSNSMKFKEDVSSLLALLQLCYKTHRTEKGEP